MFRSINFIFNFHGSFDRKKVCEFYKSFLISTDPLIERKYVNFIKVFEPECRYAPVMAANRYQNLTEGRVTQDLKKVVVTKTLPRGGLPKT